MFRLHIATDLRDHVRDVICLRSDHFGRQHDSAWQEGYDCRHKRHHWTVKFAGWINS